MDDILEIRETSADMIEYTIQDDFHIVIMQCCTYVRKIGICTKTAVNLCHIPCIITMCITFK